MKSKAAAVLGFVSLLVACGPGPTVLLGTPRSDDAGARAADASGHDARAVPSDADRDDGGDVPCDDDAVCRDTPDPLCHPERRVCVECIDDGDCAPLEHCEDDGECDD